MSSILCPMLTSLSPHSAKLPLSGSQNCVGFGTLMICLCSVHPSSQTVPWGWLSLLLDTLEKAKDQKVKLGVHSLFASWGFQVFGNVQILIYAVMIQILVSKTERSIQIGILVLKAKLKAEWIQFIFSWRQPCFPFPLKNLTLEKRSRQFPSLVL